MSARFEDTQLSREGRYAIGVDTRTGDRYLSIPVRNTWVDYEEYYRLSGEEHRRYCADPAAALAFAEQCRARRCDDRLILAPGRDRGVPA